jgi:hypothetical protein
MASTIAAITTGTGGVVTTADATGNLNLLAGTTTVVALTTAGAAVSGALSATDVKEINGVLTALGNLPYIQVVDLIAKIREQAAPQVAEQETGAQ